MSDVDAAREALMSAIEYLVDRPSYEPAYSDVVDKRIAFEATIRAEGLDVERLAQAIKATYTGGAYLNWSYYRQAAKSIAAEYARLAKDAER